MNTKNQTFMEDIVFCFFYLYIMRVYNILKLLSFDVDKYLNKKMYSMIIYIDIEVIWKTVYNLQYT